MNVTGTCFNIDFRNSTKPQICLHVSPYFWKFMFPNKDQKRESIILPLLDSNSELGATSFVRIAFKTFEMDMKYNYTGIDPVVGTIVETQKKKIDKMVG